MTIDPPTYVATVYEPFHARLSAAIEASNGVKYEITTKGGMEVAKLHRAVFRDIRIEGEKARSARKAPILEIGKLLDSKYKEIAAQVEPHESRFDTDIKAEEKRLEDEKAAKIKDEAERASAIQTRIDNIKNLPLKALTLTSKGIQEYCIDALTGIVPDAEHFGERFVEAEIAIKTSLEQLGGMLEGKKAQERLAAQQEAQAKADAEARAKREAEEQIAREAEAIRLKQEREQIERDRAELATQRQESEARQKALDDAEAAAKAKIEAEARPKAEQEAADLAEPKRKDEPVPVIVDVRPVDAVNILAQPVDKAAVINHVHPSRAALIKVVAFEYGVELTEAEGWLCAAFAQVEA
ncbi:MAG: hypothetical protein A2143_00590 [Gallionellales bacterium RBG_16_57_15]|nr:MAG: hypothetical protein A2143_00590 [Gallionellales bacterium RBG_16_57_15]